MSSCVIHKFILADISKDTVLSMPAKALILDVQIQRDKYCLWALFDTSEPPVERRFRVFGTGQTINMPGATITHLASVQDGVFVWHVFEVPL